MKKLIVILLFLATSVFAAGQSIGKPVFLLLWSDTCPHCNSFINGTMQDKRIKELLKNFDVEAINVNQQNQVPYDIDFAGVVPSVHILNQKKSQMVNTITGNVPPDDMVRFLSKFLELYAEYQKNL